MFVALRFISLVLVAVGLMFLGADIVTSLEHGGQISLRSIEQVWALFSKGGLDAFKAWLEHTLPAPVPNWIDAFLTTPAWLLPGVLGVVLAFLFGRRISHED
jgi:hypothetical protein